MFVGIVLVKTYNAICQRGLAGGDSGCSPVWLKLDLYLRSAQAIQELFTVATTVQQELSLIYQLPSYPCKVLVLNSLDGTG